MIRHQRRKRYCKCRKSRWWRKKHGQVIIYIRAKCSRGRLGKYKYYKIKKAVDKAIKNVLVEEELE